MTTAKPVPEAKRPRPAASVETPPEQPYLRFYHSKALRKRTLAVFDKIDAAEDPTVHRADLAEVIVDLMDSGAAAFFTTPLKHAKVGFLIEQTANLGLAGTMRVMAGVVRNITGQMEGAQMRSVCDAIRGFMR